MKRTFLLTLAVGILAATAFAGSLQVAEMAVTTNVVDRNPVDRIESYSATVGKLYCFTRLVGAEEDTHITHVWYRDGQEMARIDLPVRSSNWRTWSSKTILPEWTGDWRIDVLDAEGSLLTSLTFTLI